MNHSVRDVWDVPYVVAVDPWFERDAPTLGSNLTDAISGMAALLINEKPASPLLRQVGTYLLEGHYLDGYPAMLCLIRPGDANSRYRCYGRALDRMTAGRLRLLDHQPLRQLVPVGRPVLAGPVHVAEQVSALRQRLRVLLRTSHDPRSALLTEVAFSELATNTAVYGEGGRVSTWLGPDGVCFLAEDDGPGFRPLERLPSVVLVRGSSTGQRSLGAGFPLILSLAEQVSLACDERGSQCLVRLPLSIP